MSILQFLRTAYFTDFSCNFLDGVDDVYDMVAKKFTDNKTLVETREEWRNVLAVRSFTPVTKDTPRGRLDDMILVTWLGKGGQKKAQFFNANTDPSYQYSEEGAPTLRKGKGAEGLDANNDGKKDLGMLPLGVYKYNAFTSKAENDALGMVFKPTKEVRVWRDMNRDGYFTQADEELIKDEKKMFEGGTMYIHRAYRQGQPVNSWSAGCQTLKYEDFEEFRKSIETGNKAGQLEFTYVLVNFDG